MYYRRKLLLALLQTLDRAVSKIDLQKYLFLVCRHQTIPCYDFVPYRFGCYSFQADADKRTLSKYGSIKNQDHWALANRKQYLHLLRAPDQDAVKQVVKEFGGLRDRTLIQHVYRAYPYYAINSEIRHEVLNAREQEAVERARPTASPARLFTIGYEGRSLERYLNLLIVQSVRVLCDVRRNAISRKFGFSKRQLQRALAGLNIDYMHIPELGVDSNRRLHLNGPDDYQSLFDDYRVTTLKTQSAALARIARLIHDYRRVALTCFEADQAQCHRGCITDALKQRKDFRHRIVHL